MQIDSNTKHSPSDHPYLVMTALATYYGHLLKKCEVPEQTEILRLAVESAARSTQQAWDWSKILKNSSDEVRALKDFRYLESLSRRFSKINTLVNEWTLVSRRYQLALKLEANLQRCLRILAPISGGTNQKRMILDESRQRYVYLQRLATVARQHQKNLTENYAVPHKLAS